MKVHNVETLNKLIHELQRIRDFGEGTIERWDIAMMPVSFETYQYNDPNPSSMEKEVKVSIGLEYKAFLRLPSNFLGETIHSI